MVYSISKAILLWSNQPHHHSTTTQMVICINGQNSHFSWLGSSLRLADHPHARYNPLIRRLCRDCPRPGCFINAKLEPNCTAYLWSARGGMEPRLCGSDHHVGAMPTGGSCCCFASCAPLSRICFLSSFRLVFFVLYIVRGLPFVYPGLCSSYSRCLNAEISCALLSRPIFCFSLALYTTVLAICDLRLRTTLFRSQTRTHDPPLKGTYTNSESISISLSIHTQHAFLDNCIGARHPRCWTGRCCFHLPLPGQGAQPR